MKKIEEKYTLRPFLQGDEDGVLDLWKTAFKSKMEPKLFKWKYLENPYSKSMMLCVSKKDRVVTFYGGVPFKFQWINKIIYAVHLMDIMSHPAHRKDKVFERTARSFMDYYCSADKLHLMYGFPGEFHYSIGERILNYKKIGGVAYFTDSLENRNKIDYASKSGQSDVDRNVQTNVQIDVQQNVQITGVQKNVPHIRMELVENMDALSYDFDLLWESCKKDYPFSIVRNSDFVKWRYFQHPQKQYKVFRFVTSPDVPINENNTKTGTIGVTKAYVVFSIKQNKLTLIDMLMPNSKNLFMKIIGYIKEYMATANIKNIETWLPENHFFAQYALLSGFKREDEPIGFIPTVSLFDQSPPLEWITSNIYYSMADGDLF